MGERMHSGPLPEHLPPAQRERLVLLAIIHEGEAFSPAEVYRRFDPEPDPELASLTTLLEGLWAALAPGHSEGSRRVLARVSGAQRPFLAAWQGEDSEGDGFAVETLALCDACPIPEACALRGQCRVDQETPYLAMAKAQAEDQPTTPSRAAEDALGDVSADHQHPTPPWHTLAAVDAQTQAEAQGQVWLNAPGVVEQVLDELQAMTWAAWYAWWRGQISEAEARYRQWVEVRWAAAIMKGQHPGYAILPAWHLEQLPAYLRRIYYRQGMFFEWEDVPPLDEVVEGVMWACSDAANLRFQGIPTPHAPMPAEWFDRQVAEMAEDVTMHAAYLRGLVEDEGLEDE